MGPFNREKETSPAIDYQPIDRSDHFFILEDRILLSSRIEGFTLIGCLGSLDATVG